MDSVYIHIPFCNSICTYCDFCKVLYNRKWTIPYFNALKKEVIENYNGEVLSTIYIGGGTPSSLSAHELNKLFEIIKLFNIDKNTEFTYECNIEDIDEELIEILITNGVNRISIGIESFNETFLNTMDRPLISFEKAKEKVDLCRLKGIKNINIDLIYGFKDQKLTDIKADLKKIVALKTEHISTYSLMINDNTFLGIDKYERLDDDKDAKIYEFICKKLKSNGFIHYEVSNFAQPSFTSSHNLKYWNNEEYYGFGLGASGYIAGLRYDNTRSLTNYLNGVTKVVNNLISKKEIMEYELMLGLRKLKGINLQEFYDKYKVNLQEVFPIQPLVNNRELIYKNGFIYIPEDKIYIMNEILVKLL